MKSTELKFVELTHRSGWMGGKWYVGDDPYETYIGNCVILKIGRSKFEATVVERNGMDYDHGHEINWTNFDFAIRTSTALGKVDVSVKKLLTGGKKVKMWRAI